LATTIAFLDIWWQTEMVLKKAAAVAETSTNG